MQAGIYYGISNDDYHADPAVSSSGIKMLLRCPEEYWFHYIAGLDQDESTKSTKFGTAYHTYILEPSHFSYEVLPGQKTTTKEGCLAEAEMQKIQAMAERLHSNPRHSQLFRGGYAEVSIVWKDEETGVMCRIRPDYWKPNYITDLKTIDDIHGGIFHDAPKYGHDVSAAMYMEGMRQARIMLKDSKPDWMSEGFRDRFLKSEGEIFTFLYQGKKPPYITRAQPIAPDTAAVGFEKFRRGLDIYRTWMEECGTETRWPSGYPDFEDMTLDTLSNRINYV
jgi:exodeoxyribonuclease VIII